MEEELLKSIYSDLGLESQKISFNDFSSKMEENKELRSSVYSDLGLEQAGLSYDDFESKLFVKKKESTPSGSLDGQSPSQEDELQITEEQTTPQTDTPFGADWETKTTEPDTFAQVIEERTGVKAEDEEQKKKLTKESQQQEIKKKLYEDFNLKGKSEEELDSELKKLVGGIDTYESFDELANKISNKIDYTKANRDDVKAYLSQLRQDFYSDKSNEKYQEELDKKTKEYESAGFSSDQLKNRSKNLAQADIIDKVVSYSLDRLDLDENYIKAAKDFKYLRDKKDLTEEEMTQLRTLNKILQDAKESNKDLTDPVTGEISGTYTQEVNDKAEKLKSQYKNDYDQLSDIHRKAYYRLQFLEDKKEYEEKAFGSMKEITRQDYAKAAGEFDAINRALMLNEDPSAIEKSVVFMPFTEGLIEAGAETLSSVARLATGEEVDLSYNLRSGRDYINDYVDLVSREGGKVTEEQKADLKQGLTEQVSRTLGAMIPTAAEFIAIELATEGLGSEVAATRVGKRLLDLYNKQGKVTQFLVKQTGDLVKEGAKFEMTTQGDFAMGVGEGAAGKLANLVTKKLKFGKIPNKLLRETAEFVTGTTARTGGIIAEEYSGDYLSQAMDSGFDSIETFEKVFGRDYDEAMDKFTVLGLTSFMMGGSRQASLLLTAARKNYADNGDQSGVEMVNDIAKEAGLDIDKAEADLKEEGPDTFLEKADKEVESITEKTDDKKDKEGIPSEEQVGEEPVEGKLDEITGEEEVETSGVLQAQEEVEYDESLDEIKYTQSKTDNNKEKLLDLKDEYNELPKNSKRRKEISVEAGKLASDSGLNVSFDNNKMQVKSDKGTNVKRADIKAEIKDQPADDISNVKKAIRLGILTSTKDTPGSKLDLPGISTADMNQGIKDLRDGKENSIAAKKLTIAFRQGLKKNKDLAVKHEGGHTPVDIEKFNKEEYSFEDLTIEEQREILAKEIKANDEIKSLIEAKIKEAGDLATADTKKEGVGQKVLNVLDSWEASIDEQLKGTAGMNIVPLAAKAVIKTAKVAVKAGMTLEQAIRKGLDDFKKTKEYESLTPEQKQAVDQTTETDVINDLARNLDPEINKKIDSVLKEQGKKLKAESTSSTEAKRKSTKEQKERSKEGIKKVRSIGKDTSAETKSTIAKDLKKRIIDLSKGSKLGVKAVKQKLNDIKTAIKEHAAKGKLSQRQTQSILAKVEKTNFDKIESVKELDTHVENILNDVEYSDKKSAANTLQKQLKKAGKAKDSLTKDTAVKLGNLPIHKIKDIDSFLALGESLVNSLRGKEVLSKEYKNKLDEFIEKAEKDIAQYDSDLQEAKLEKAYDDFGGKDSGLTYEEFKEYVDLKADDSIEKELDKETVSKIEKLRSVLPFEIAALEQYAKDNPNDVSKSLLNKLKNLDLSELSPSQVLDVHNAITEVVVFDSPKGVGRIETMLEGKEKSKDVDKSLSAKIIRAVDSVKKASLLSYPQFIKAITKTKEAAKDFNSKVMGGYNKGYNKAVLVSDKFMNSVDKLFNKTKNSYQSSVNTGMVGWMIQHEVGLTEEEIQQDFNNKKESIKNQLNRLKNLSTPVSEVQKNQESLKKEQARLEKEIKEAASKEDKLEINKKLQEVKDKLSVLGLSDRSRNHYKNTYESYKTAYDNLIKDANSKSELESKLSKEERQALKFIESEFAKNKDSFKDVNERYNGKTIIEYERYTPTYAKKMGGEASDIDLINGVPDLKAKDVSVKEAGSAQKRVAVDVTGNTLYSFDLNAIAKQRMYEQQYEINTLKERQVLKSMLSDPKMKDAMHSDEFLNVLKQRTARVAQLRKAKITDDINTMSSGFGKFVYKAMRNLKLTHLRTLDQYIKQTVPILIQTSTQASRGMGVALKQGVKMITSKAHREAFNELVKKSEVAIRATDGELALDPSNKSLLENVLGVFRKEGTMVSRMYSNIVGDAVGNSDSFATRTSWLALLAKEAKKAGIPYSEFDLVKHKDLITNDIISKADTESTAINNSSDFTQASDTFTNPDKKFIRELLWTYKSFSLNLAVNNLIEFRNLKYGSAGDKAASSRYILGSMMGVLAFQAVKEFVVNSLIYDPLLASTLGLEEDDEDVSKQASEVALKAAADYFTGWMPANFDSFAKQSANYVNSEIIKKQLADMSESEKQMLEREGDLPNPKHSLFFDNNEVFTGSLGILYDALKQSGEVGENLLNEEELNASDEYKAISLIGLLSGEGNVSRIFQKAYYKAKKEEKKENN